MDSVSDKLHWLFDPLIPVPDNGSAEWLYDTYAPICYRQLLKNVPEEQAKLLLSNIFETAFNERFDYKGITLTLWLLRITNRILLVYGRRNEIKY